MAPPAEPPTVPTNLRAPLWSHVQIIEKTPGGGNTKWKCDYCGHEALSSYSRVSAHLLKKTGNHGIHACKKATVDILNPFKKNSKTYPYWHFFKMTNLRIRIGPILIPVSVSVHSSKYQIDT